MSGYDSTAGQRLQDKLRFTVQEADRRGKKETDKNIHSQNYATVLIKIKLCLENFERKKQKQLTSFTQKYSEGLRNTFKKAVIFIIFCQS